MKLITRRRRNPAITESPASEPARASRILPRQLFDEAAYLARNPDVAAAAAQGQTTAYGHYVKTGFKDEAEGRRQVSVPTQSHPLSGRYNENDALRDRVIDLEVEKRALLDLWDRHVDGFGEISFDMLSEDVDDLDAPPLDRQDCDEGILDEDQRFWRQNGYVIKPGFIPHDLLDRYSEIRARVPAPGGWSCPVPYMHVPELRGVSLYRPLTELLERLIGEEMGLHLNLTGWVSTDRNWHQDDYLNPPYINSWYAAVWIALDDIHPDCGPFEFVPGSHKWPVMKSHRVRMFLKPHEREDDAWPSIAERFVNDVATREIERSGLEPQRFIARKGDVLIWHGRLMHRGSYANVPGMQRKALISHFSGVSHRFDMPVVKHTADGSAYFHLPRPLDFDPYAVAEEKVAASA